MNELLPSMQEDLSTNPVRNFDFSNLCVEYNLIITYVKSEKKIAGKVAQLRVHYKVVDGVCHAADQRGVT